MILAEGGLTTDWNRVRDGVPLALILATLGVVVSFIVHGVAVHYLLGFDWRMSLLVGGVIASTDAAAVFSVLRRLPLKPKLGGILEAESGFNDPPAVIVVMLLSQAADPTPSIGELLLGGLYQLGVGTIVAFVAGPLGVQALRRVALPASGLYPIAVLALAFIAYSGAALLGGSGFLAVYIASIILGNARLPHRTATRGFAEGAAWLAQIGLFVMLGLLASPSELPDALVPAFIAGLALILIARPISVVVSVLVARLTRLGSVTLPELVFLSWAGLRGAVPIVLTTIPWAAGVPGAQELFDIIFIIVVVFTLLQGPTLPFAAKLLKVTAEDEAREVTIEAAPLEELKADVLQVRIPPGSQLQGVEIFELRLPPDARVPLVVRDGSPFVPSPSDRLQVGDQFLVIIPAAHREQVERRLRAVSRRGKLAAWYGERGD